MTTFSKDRVRNIFFFALIIGAVFAAYGNSLRGDFLMDDIPIIVDNPLIKDLKNIPVLFSTSYWGLHTSAEQPTLNYYRPLTMLTYALNHAVNGLKPWGYHLVNLLAHAAVCCLLLLLLLKQKFTLRESLSAALCFAVLPIHTEAVSSIVGRAEILAMLGITTAWLLAFNETKRMNFIGAIGCYFLALMSKESSACFPLLLILSEYRISRNSPWELVKKRALWLAGFAGVLIVYLALRRFWLGSFLPSTATPYFSSQSLLVRALTVSQFFFEGYLWPMVTGLNLCADYLRPTVPDAQVSDLFAWACLLTLLLAAGWALVRFILDKSKIALPALIFLVFYLPVSNLVLDIAYYIGAERFLYAPSLGFAIFFGIFAAQTSARSKIGGWLLLALVLPWWTWRTIERNKVWRSETEFYGALLKEKPTNPNGWIGWGGLLDKQGQPTEARKFYRHALTLNPSLASAKINIGASYFFEGQSALAKKWFLENTDLQNPAKDTLTFLGLIEVQEKNFTQAHHYFSQAAELYPLDPDIRNNLEQINQKMSGSR